MNKPKTALLRDLLRSSRLLVKPGAYDALSAQIIERAGFEVLGLSGYAISVSLLGKPDVGLVTMTEIVDVCRRVSAAVGIPVIADADTGYGNAINVMRTTEEFIRAGAAAIHIEDQVSPKRCGHVAGKQVVGIEEAVGKFRAAARVRDELDPNFVIIARTDARGVQGGTLADVIARANAYADAGADMIFPEGLTSIEEVRRVCAEVSVPVHYNRTGVSPLLDREELQACGVKMVSNATGSLRAAARAMFDYMAAFKAGDAEFLKAFFSGIADHPVGDMHEFVGFKEIMALEAEYLPAEDAQKYNGSIGYSPL
ncbi:isocitrate lyase/PEP mutase family protein [Devosia sp.]|uniref:isocitrate lyase/PEP mutase family protein n=1 Tax=Devosia sp. TaxID=1871048 RepID=UPI002EF4DD6C